MKILDCTLRDGGYYTAWDFDKELVDSYLNAINQLPIDIIEVGYRSEPKNEYLGEYFYCPNHVIKYLRQNCIKEIAIMFNEKEVRPNMIDNLLKGCEEIDIIRLAVDPQNYLRAIELSKAIKLKGFKVAFNVMYMSKWDEYPEFKASLHLANDSCDYFNMVDSYGGVYPEDVKRITQEVCSVLTIPVGFHGHNNLELGLINSLTALDNNASIIDATITGMGRGAGNLKTELLLTALNSQRNLEVDFNILGGIVNMFEELKSGYNWGTNLPYMIAGANSFPQKDVMEWVSNRFYSYNSIIRTLQNKKEGKSDNEKLELLKFNKNVTKVLIVGGGPSSNLHSEGIEKYLENNEDVVIIHASSKNALPYKKLKNKQIFCLIGNEGRRMEKVFDNLGSFKGKCILPPFPRKMGTYIPEAIRTLCYELKEINFTDTLTDTHTSIALQTAIDLGAEEALLVGYDGYVDNVTGLEVALAQENNYLFEQVKNRISIKSLFPSAYKLDVVSLYSLYE
jgi:4-hydroxy 2-oxovalerate aldolase